MEYSDICIELFPITPTKILFEHKWLKIPANTAVLVIQTMRSYAILNGFFPLLWKETSILLFTEELIFS